MCALALATMSNCLDATEITIVLETDVACGTVNANGVSIAIGAPADESQPPSALGTTCSDGGIGSLVVLPSHAIDEPVGIRVVLGVDRKAELCSEDAGYAGCIVARRAIRYAPHHPLVLPIDLQQSCVGQACDPTSTCVNAACVDASAPCDPNGDCTIDAGAPPTQACAPPVLVAPLASTTLVTPRLVQVNALSYAVAWETQLVNDPSRAYDAVVVTSSGGPSSSVSTFATSPTLAVGSNIGPLGTDGVSLLAAMYQSTSSVIIAIPFGGTLGQSTSTPTITESLFGMFYEPSRTGYVFAGLSPPMNWPSLIVASPTGGTVTVNPMATVIGMAGIGLVRYGNFYFATMHDNAATCWLRPATMSGTTFTMGTTQSFSGCDAMRYAQTPSANTLVATSSSGALSVSINGTNGIPLGPVNAENAFPTFQALVTGTTFRVVWTHGGVISTSPFTGSSTSAATTDLFTTGFTSGYGSGFDAVSDGATGYALAFWANLGGKSGVYFTHCN